jgi:hypothetical protein
MFNVHLKIMYILFLLDGVIYEYQLVKLVNSVSQVFYNLIHFLSAHINYWKTGIKSLSIIVDLSASPYSSMRFCFICFDLYY